jgi:hypothetical protein
MEQLCGRRKRHAEVDSSTRVVHLGNVRRSHPRIIICNPLDVICQCRRLPPDDISRRGHQSDEGGYDGNA